MHDTLLIFVAFSLGINAIAIEALIDMHHEIKARKKRGLITWDVFLKLQDEKAVRNGFRS